MPQPKNHLLRVLVPVIATVAGIGVAIAMFQGSKPKPAPTPEATPSPSSAASSGTPAGADVAASTPTPTTATPEAASPDAAPTIAAQPDATTPTPAPTPTPAAPAAATSAAPVLRATVFPDATLATLGSHDKGSAFKAQIEFSPSGAGIRLLTLTDHFTSIKENQHVTVQSEHTIQRETRVDALTPMAALAVEVTSPGAAPVIVPLAGSERLWRQVNEKPGHFEAIIADASGTPVLRIEREFMLAKGEHNFSVRQRLINLSPGPLTVRWYQNGPVDLEGDAESYGGDKRRVRFGYLLPASKDPPRQTVISNNFLIQRSDALGSRGQNLAYADKMLWPNAASRENSYDLVWAGTSNRYFGVTVHPRIDPTGASPNKVFTWVESVDRVVLDGGSGLETLALRLTSKPMPLAAAGQPGSTADLSHDVYAGPLSRRAIKAEPILKSLGIAGLVVYNFGGFCGFCTFDWMTGLLLWLLLFLESIIRDWALAIFALVVVVRTILHPVTKWSQIRMARFGKQMQAVAPKQKAIQDKFKNDPAKLREETGKLWREEGISPAGFLGCLPAFLQTPVWIALYATLYFAVELRHQPAFYGAFQAVIPKGTTMWPFLGDLAEPDRFIYFGKVIVNLPLLGPISSVNVLPIILGIVFFIQQKYLTPPTTATLTPEQELQQKMVKWMMVIMFPLMMYNAPAGLSLYFICNSTLGILESRYIRSHMDKYGMLDLDKMKAERQARQSRSGRGAQPAQKGFFARLQELAEQKQREAMQKQQKRGKPGR